MPNAGDSELFANLRELAEATFPKRCRNCGREYRDATEFVAATTALADGRSGLKQSLDDDGKQIVELFRNCVCGSTLMDAFNDRRDPTPQGLRRRQRFEELLTRLVDRGIDAGVATVELKKTLRGEPSELLKLIEATK